MTLFRKEALAFRQESAMGEILVPVRLSYVLPSIFFGSVFAAVLLFLCFGTYAKTANVSGQLTAAEGLSRLVIERPGIVKSLRVSEGDYVEAGDLLVAVETAVSGSDGASVEDQLLQFRSVEKSLIEQQIRLVNQQNSSEEARLKSEIEALNNRISSLNRRLELQQQMTESARLSRDDARELLEQNYISRLEYENLNRTFNANQIEENIIAQDIASLGQQQQDLRSQLSQLPGKTEQETAQLQRQKLEVDSRSAELGARKDYIVRAPVSGVVSSLNVTSVGQTVAAQTAIATIAPGDSELVAELYIPSSAIGFVQTGHEVKLLYEAFPYQRFGAFDAQITRVTENILLPGEVDTSIGLNQAIYRARAALKDQTLNIGDTSVSLRPGMAFEAVIVLERRSFLYWLLNPIRSVAKTQ